jgi:hypothetical protein
VQYALCGDVEINKFKIEKKLDETMKLAVGK